MVPETCWIFTLWSKFWIALQGWDTSQFNEQWILNFQVQIYFNFCTEKIICKFVVNYKEEYKYELYSIINLIFPLCS